MNEELDTITKAFAECLISATEMFNAIIRNSEYSCAVGEDCLDESEEDILLFDVWTGEDDVQTRIRITEEQYDELVEAGCEQY